jgi:hypothetical protein
MDEVLVAALIFVCLLAASLGSLAYGGRLPARYRDDDTQNVVRLIAGLFSIMTSLVLGLMINSAKNTLESVDRNIHAFAAELIVLDRTLRQYGPEAADTRQRLLRYADRAAHSARHEDPMVADRVSERLLDDVGASLKALTPADAERTALMQSARQTLQKIVDLRWIIVGQAEGMIPAPILVMVVAWLMLIFASFGYRAPRNALVVSGLALSSLLMAGALYLILDMDSPFSGPIQVASKPLERVVAEIRQ